METTQSHCIIQDDDTKNLHRLMSFEKGGEAPNGTGPGAGAPIGSGPGAGTKGAGTYVLAGATLGQRTQVSISSAGCMTDWRPQRASIWGAVDRVVKYAIKPTRSCLFVNSTVR